MKRWLYIGGGVIISVLVLVGIGLYFLLSSLNSIVKAAVEKYGSDVTQVVVRLNEVDIELTSGKGALRGLTVGNPSGFKSARAMSLGEISLQLDVGSVTQDTVVIKEISITGPEVMYEFGLKGSNIDALRRNVNAYAAQRKDKRKGEAAPEEPDKQGRKLVVERLYIRDGKVNVSATELQGKSANASLPDIQLTDIGKKTGGATAGELAEQILAAIGRSAAGAAATTDISKLIGAAKISEATAVLEGAEKAGAEALKKFFGK